MKGDIIPGLPDDLGLRCLAMISHGYHSDLQTVCKKWRDVFRSHHYGNLKSALGFSGDWIFVLSQTESRSALPHWTAYDPASNSWHPLPLLPLSHSLLSHRDFSCVSVNGRFLLIGGLYTHDTPYNLPDFSSHVLQFDPCRNQWTRAAPMLSPRSNFACAVVAGKVIVAGGWNYFTRGALSSAEIYDPLADRWEELPAMPRPVSYCIGLSIAAMFYVISELDDERPLETSTPLVFDPANGTWRTDTSANGTLELGTVVMGDQRQYAVDNWGSSVIKTRGSTDDAWARVGCVPPVAVPGQREPLESFNFSVVGLRGNLYVLGGNALICGTQCEVITLSSVRVCDVNVRPLEWKELKPMCCNATGAIIGCASLAQDQI